MSDLISVIVPVYNVEEYLPKCLDSIVNQTYQNLEIILVDDGSTDKSGQICDEYAAKDKRIKVIHKKNRGQSLARNVGLDIAQGKFIGFVDSDDWIEKDMYEQLYCFIIKNACDAAACGFIIEYDWGGGGKKLFANGNGFEYKERNFKIFAYKGIIFME